MQRLEGLLRKAVQDYEMIAPGDRVCVGVSGGKDSVALTVALGHLRRYLGVPFEVMAVTLDPRFGGVEADYQPLADLFAQQMSRDDPAFRQKTLHALQQSGIDGWRPLHTGHTRG